MKTMHIDDFAKEQMNGCTSYRYGGYSFEQWYDWHTKSCFCWVGRYDKEELRTLYESLPSEIKVGMPCTINYYSDRRGCTITEIEYTKTGKPKRVGVMHNKYTINDCYEGTGKCTDEIATNMGTDYFTIRKNGGWYAEGQPKSSHSVYLAIGFRSTYIDPNF